MIDWEKYMLLKMRESNLIGQAEALNKFARYANGRRDGCVLLGNLDEADVWQGVCEELIERTTTLIKDIKALQEEIEEL